MPPRSPPAPYDPRDWVTPDDLNVAPELLGAPLARPGRRLLAITIDVLIVALLSNLGNVWLLAGLGLLALVHLRAAEPDQTPRRRWFLWALAAVLIAAGVQQAWVSRGAPESDEHESARGSGQGLVIDGLPEAVPGLTPLQAAETQIALLKAQLADARKPKAFDLNEQIHTWADEVGLGLGWAIVYFSLLPVWWNGQTVGKRLLACSASRRSSGIRTARRSRTRPRIRS